MLSGRPCRAFSRFGLDNLNTPNRERFGVPTVWNVSILFYTQASSREAVGPPRTLEGARPAPSSLELGAVLYTISDHCFELTERDRRWPRPRRTGSDQPGSRQPLGGCTSCRRRTE